MAISLNWLKDYIDIDDISTKELAEKITKAGVNVESFTTNKIDNIVIGHVLEVNPHPDSDHLNVCSVDIGTSVTTIVCGASNVRKGLKVLVALPGAILPGDFEIKKSTIRNVESNGMICALYELGLEEKTKESYDKGIEELNSDAPVGEDGIKYLGLDDTILHLDLNPNRNIDCTNHIGFAYEVASVLNKKVTLPESDFCEISESINDNLKISIDTPNCTYYSAKMVKDVVIKESPDFIKNRLISAGMRPINNVVDISNYVMLEYGQPLHFFDKDKLNDKIAVRMANDNETIVTLDGKSRELLNSDIVITDGYKPVCIAGIMGGENTEIDSNSKNVLIEAAIFNSYNIRYSSIRLDLRSEASVRYERGLNYENTKLALNRACYLLEKYADGKVLTDTILIDNVDKKEKKASVTLNQVNKLLGMKLTSEVVEKSLNSLGFDYEKSNDEYIVTIPNRRLDIEPNSADLIEEIGRLYGYDNIVSKLPICSTKPGVYVGNVRIKKLISKRLRSLGLNEVRTYTLISEEEDNLFNYNKEKSVKLNKPMSLDKAIVRQSLISSLLKVVDYNKSRNIKDVFIYEISNVYYNEMDEDTKVSIAIKGNYIQNNWSKVDVKADFYLIKGLVENLLDYLGLKNRYSFNASNINEMHPGMTAEIMLDRESIGFIGKVHPSVSKNDVFVAEISLNKIINKKVKPIKHKEPSKYPEITRDLAFVVKKDLEAQNLITQIKKSGGRLLSNVDVFDVYVGENVQNDEKSLAFSLVFMDSTRTLNDEEVTEVYNKIIKDVEDNFDAKLRR